MKRELYDVQKLHASIIMSALANHGSALDGSATGCGKTLVASEIASQLRRPTFVVGLKGSLPMWKLEMETRGWPCIGALNYEMLRTGRTPYGSWHPGKLWEWNLPKDALIIWDEVQNCQGVSSLNSRMLMQSKGATNLLLSATAAEDPTEMRSTGYVLGLHNLRDWYQWCKKQGCTVNPWGKMEFGTGDRDKDDAIIAAIHDQIFPSHGNRLTRADMKEHFQETQIIMTPLDFGKEIEAIYDSMEAELGNLAEIMKSDSTNPAAEALIAKLRARQKVELLKVPYMIELTNALIKEGDSVVLFVNFDATIEALFKHLPFAKIISGKAKEPRTEVERAFLADECRLVIANSQAGGVYLSLHDLHGRHPRTAIISPDWNPKKILQVIGRIDRAGGQTPTQQHILFAANTVEVEVKNTVEAGMRRIGILNDGLDKPLAKNEPLCQSISTVKEENSVEDSLQPAREVEHAPAAGVNPKDLKKVDPRNTGSGLDTIITPGPEHAEYNPSSMSLFEKCPGYRNRNEETEATKKGHRIHKALEQGQIDSLADEEKPIAQACQDFIDGLIAEHLPHRPDNDFRELKLHMDLGAGIETFGTCDRLLVWGNHGDMLDYKSGYMEITEAETNAQAWCYVIGAFQKQTLLKQPLETITFYFLVPNRDQVLYHTFKRSDVPTMQLRLNTIVRRAMAADPKQFNPQPGLCEFCARQTTCPALALKALPILQKLGAGLPVPKNIIVSASRPSDIPHLLRLAPIMEAWGKQIKSDATKVHLEHGVEVEGYKLVERITPRSISSAMGAWEVLQKLNGNIPLAEFLAACGKVSVPQLEALVAELAPNKQKGKAKKDLENELRHRDLLSNEGTVYYLKEKRS